MFIRAVVICGSRVSTWLRILSHALYKLLTWQSLRRVMTSCCNICRLTATRVLPTPAPCYRAHIATYLASLPDNWISWKDWPTKTRSIFPAEPLPHAFRSVFCFNKQATLTGLFFVLPKARGTDTSRYLPVNNVAEKRIRASAIASECVPDEDKNKSSEFEFLWMFFFLVVQAGWGTSQWRSWAWKALTFVLFFPRRKRTFVYRWGL